MKFGQLGTLDSIHLKFYGTDGPCKIPPSASECGAASCEFAHPLSSAIMKAEGSREVHLARTC